MSTYKFVFFEAFGFSGPCLNTFEINESLMHAVNSDKGILNLKINKQKKQKLNSS